jgi:hypothetical protein
MTTKSERQCEMNESFIPNTVGKTVSFEVQPYRHGTGKVVAMRGRVITVSEFSRQKGRARVTYEVFDVDVLVSEGGEVGAFSCGVAVPGTGRDLAGRTVTLIGVDFGQVHAAAHADNPQPIIIARCG